jgi:heme-degrading monooxygenase HmoA
MIARVTHYTIRAGKIEEFSSTAKNLTAAIDKLEGFRALVVLRGEGPGSREAMAISIWDSAEDLKNSDNSAFYYEGIRGLMSCCESFSPGHRHEVLVSKFAKT